jgi:hypothetical protein
MQNAKVVGVAFQVTAEISRKVSPT